MKLIECVPNFSEGIDRSLISQITSEITSISGIKLLDEDQIEALSKFKNKKIMNNNGDEVGRIEAHLEF